jgi:hypothetical protein
MTTFVIFNIDTEYFYSESPIIKRAAKHAGIRWDRSCIRLTFARRFTCHKDAVRRSQKLSDLTGCVCAVMALPERMAA